MHRMAKPLLEQFVDSITSVQTLLSRRVKVGSQLGERFQFGERRQVQTHTAGYLFHTGNLSVAADSRNRNTGVHSRSLTAEEQVRLKVNLTVGNGNDVGRNVRGNFAFQSFDNRQSRQRTAAEVVGQFGGSFQQTAVTVEDVARVSFASWRTAHKQRQLTIRNRLFAQVVVNAQGVFALVHEVFCHGAAGVRSNVLQWSRRRRAGNDDRRVFHRAFASKRVNKVSDC